MRLANAARSLKISKIQEVLAFSLVQISLLLFYKKKSIDIWLMPILGYFFNSAIWAKYSQKNHTN